MIEATTRQPQFRVGQQVIITNSNGNSPSLTIAEIKNTEGTYRYKFTNDEELYPEEMLSITPPAWQWSSLSDAYKPKPPISYVTQDILLQPSLNIFYGEPGGFKTMLVMDLAMCVVSGQDWLTGLPDKTPVTSYKCEQSPVLWIDVDNGCDLIERRFKAIGNAHKVSEDSPIRYVSFPPFALNDSGQVGELVRATEYFKAKLIVFDNLGTISGGVEENSSQMIGAMSELRKIAETTRSAIIAIHHTTKKTKSLRGHSSINAAVDLALLVNRNGDKAIMSSTKTRHAPIEPFSALWIYRIQNGELATGRFFGLGDEGVLPIPKQQIVEAVIMDSMTDGMNQSQIVEMLEGTAGRDTTLKALKSLVADEQLREELGPTNSKLYFHQDL